MPNGKEHPFYTLEEEWVEAGSLWQGAHVRKADGSYGVVQGIEMVQQRQLMYNLTVAEAHTFFVGDGEWLVHNSCPRISLFRGGLDLKPRLGVDVLVDKNTGLLKTTRGVSLFDHPGKVEKFGGAFKVDYLPRGLKIGQRGQAGHYEIMPAEPMTFERYAGLLRQVVLSPVGK